jgi:hypothetical protein
MFGELKSAERASHCRAYLVAIFGGEVDPRVRNRHLRSRYRKMSVPVETLRSLAVEIIAGIEVIHLGGVVTLENGGIEARYRFHRRLLPA